MHVRDNVLTSGTTLNNGVHYDDHVETKSLSSSTAADTVYVESPPAGMVLGDWALGTTTSASAASAATTCPTSWRRAR